MYISNFYHTGDNSIVIACYSQILKYTSMESKVRSTRRRNAKSAAPACGDPPPTSHEAPAPAPAPQEERQLRQQQRRKVQFDALHQEMELVEYSVSATGQPRRILPRHLSLERTKKRRLLEKQEQATHNESDHTPSAKAKAHHRKIRGPKAAAEDHVVEASLVFGAKSVWTPDEGDDDGILEEEVEAQDKGDGGQEEGDDEEDADVDVPIDEEEEASDNELHENEESTLLPELAFHQSPSSKGKPRKGRGATTTKFTNFKRKKTTRLKRLKNFTSVRMAQKHGAALGAHIQGKSDVAIQTLKQIAKRVPTAPQIYSSLGMVYEDLLHESQAKGNGPDMDETQIVKAARKSIVDQDLNTGQSDQNAEDTDTVQATVHDKSLRNQLSLAKKAYGSYHAAAILYKRDYSLWLRAADSAYEIANVHTAIMKLPDIAENLIEYHRAEKKKWLIEAKNDYQTADNLQPPGIEIPAKLAHVMIELGMLSEALTLLTGLKHQAEFHSSYRAWLLFADLMLRIGHECRQWNANSQTNGNNMFRKWLRKWSASFDWKERRMQALVKALEAACGTVCCRALMNWIHKRVADTADDESQQLVDDASRSNTNDATTNNHPITSHSTEQGITVELPLTGSCRTVFSIASELIRQMLDMNLHHGGILVGDSVSLYLKERQTTCTNRKITKEEFDVLQKRPISSFAMQPELYDVGDDDDNDDEKDVDRDVPVSDDEDWDTDDVAPAIRKGTLPPELRFLYGLCLLDDHRKVPLANVCIQSLYLLPSESTSYFTEPIRDYGVSQDLVWTTLRETMTEPLGRVTALSLTTDILRNCSLEAELQDPLRTLFVQCVSSLYDEGWIDRVVNMERNLSTVSWYRREQLIKVLISAERYSCFDDNQSDETNDTSSKTFLVSLTKLSTLILLAWKVHPNGVLDSNCVDIVVALSSLLRRYIENVSNNGSICPTTDSENIASQLFNIFSILCGTTALNKEDPRHQQPIDLTVTPIKSSWLTTALKSMSTKVFNLCVGLNVSNFSGWQVKMFTMKSRSLVEQCNYFGISTDEGPISGYLTAHLESEVTRIWDLVYTLYPDKVSFDFKRELGILKSSDRYKKCRSKYIAQKESEPIFEFGEDCGLRVMLNFAYICLSIESSTCKRLHAVAFSILLPATQFLLKEPLWDANIGINIATETAIIPQCQFDASIANQNATKATPSQRPDAYITNKNPTKVAPTRRPDLYSTNNITTLPVVAPAQIPDAYTTNNKATVVAPSLRPGYIRPSKRQLPLPSNSTGEIWFSWEDGQRPKSNLFNVSLPTLAQIWNDCSDFVSGEGTLVAQEIMKDVDDCTGRLRLCYTIQAAEQLSMIIATSLIKLLEFPVCQNPFAVMQLAAMFASQGPKGGSSDHLFRARLPKAEDCTSQNALMILGRAECMNALHFCQEATYLCSYVVNVCRLNCGGDIILQGPKRRWVLLSIIAYDISIMIRMMAKSIIGNFTRREDSFGEWANVVVDWFRQIRKTSRLTERLLSNEHSKSVDTARPVSRTSISESI